MVTASTEKKDGDEDDRESIARPFSISTDFIGVFGSDLTIDWLKSLSVLTHSNSIDMPLTLEHVLIRRKDNSLPEGSSGYVVRLPSVFLSMLPDGAKIKGVLKQDTREQEVTLMLEKASCDDFLHIVREDWIDTIKDGRADLRLTEAFLNGKWMRLYEQREVITSPAHACKISSR